MKKIGRVTFKPNKVVWRAERFSFVIYKDKGDYFVKIKEKHENRKKLLDWDIHKWNLLDMISIINDKMYNGGKITINTLPQEVMDRANKELILKGLE